METFEVRRDELARTRVSQQELPALQDGQLLVAVDRFALTANNITYGVAGEKIGYWKFFPAGEGWGIIPVWGFGDVVESRHAAVPAGDRLYGYFPMGTHLVLNPGSVREERLIDAMPHRAELPPVYNTYARVRSEPHYQPAMDDERSLLFPLYATSFCLYDFLLDNDWFGARQVLILSASSKTGLGLAMALANDIAAPPAIALTSRRNLEWVRGLGLYADVHAYEELSSTDAAVPAVIVDMSGHGPVLSALHAHLGDNMRYCAKVGITHYDEPEVGPDFIRERSKMFFAPAHIQKRAGDWGPGEFQRKAFRFWHEAARQSRSWLKIETFNGLAGMETAYHRVLSGDVTPDHGVIVAL